MAGRPASQDVKNARIAWLSQRAREDSDLDVSVATTAPLADRRVRHHHRSADHQSVLWAHRRDVVGELAVARERRRGRPDISGECSDRPGVGGVIAAELLDLVAETGVA